jgi:flagellar basal-body rod modification protein FlgD
MGAVISPDAATRAAPTSGSAPVSAATDKALEMFTTLLVAQVRNQDPLSPTDPTQFVQQLTQQTQMEALQKLASQGSANAEALNSLRVIGLGGQVGSEVAVATDRVVLSDQPVRVSFQLQGASGDTRLVLTGTDGAQHVLDLGRRGVGSSDVAVDPAALGLPPGRYALRIETDSKEAPAVEVHGRLASVRLSASGDVQAEVDHVGVVSPESITQFNGRPGA